MADINKKQEEFREQAANAIEMANETDAEALQELDTRQCIKNSFEAVGFTCSDVYDGDIRNAMILTKGKQKIALVYSDGEITKENIVAAYKMRSRLKVKECAVSTFSNVPDQTIHIARNGGKVVRRLVQKDKKLDKVFQFYTLR